MHSERTALQREEIIKRFRLGEIWVLICTDLMSRGVDFKGVNMVINYDLPQSAVGYIHRFEDFFKTFIMMSNTYLT